MLNRFKIPVIVVATVLLNQVVSRAVSAGTPAAFLPPGTTRYAVASASSGANTTSGSMSNLPGMSASITIPEGRRGDVFVLFCGDLYTTSTTLVQAMIGGTVALPGALQLRASPPGGFSESRCGNFYKLNVGAGTKTIRIQWASTPGQLSTMLNRSLLVTVNIH